MSKSAKHLKVPVGHTRSYLDVQALVLLAQKAGLHSTKTDAASPALKPGTSLSRAPANPTIHRSSLSPARSDTSSLTLQSIPSFLRRSVSKEHKEALSPELKPVFDGKTSEDSIDSGKRKRSLRRSTLGWSLGDIEIRLNERLIKGSQSSDAREKFLACREALQEVIETSPGTSSLLSKIAKGIDAWTGSLESSRLSSPIDKPGDSTAKAAEEVGKLREKVAYLTKENNRLSRQLSDTSTNSAFPSPDSHISGLITSLQEEVRIHRKREDLLMNIINTLREKGYPVDNLQKSPLSEKQLSEESTRSCAETDKGMLAGDYEDCDLTYSPTPGFDTEDSVQLLPSDARAAVPRLTLPISNDIGHKGVDLRLKTHTQQSP